MVGGKDEEITETINPLSVCLFLSLCLSICLSLSLPLSLSISLSVCLSVCLSLSLSPPLSLCARCVCVCGGGGGGVRARARTPFVLTVSKGGGGGAIYETLLRCALKFQMNGSLPFKGLGINIASRHITAISTFIPVGPPSSKFIVRGCVVRGCLCIALA